MAGNQMAKKFFQDGDKMSADNYIWRILGCHFLMRMLGF
jgi:hypothetical protein